MLLQSGPRGSDPRNRRDLTGGPAWVFGPPRPDYKRTKQRRWNDRAGRAAAAAAGERLPVSRPPGSQVAGSGPKIVAAGSWPQDRDRGGFGRRKNEFRTGHDSSNHRPPLR